MAEPNVTICLDPKCVNLDKAPTKVVAQILVAEMTLGAFHVGDILCIGQVNYKVLGREIKFLHTPGVPTLQLYLFVTRN